MNDEAAFRRAIKKNPKDAMPRLAFAARSGPRARGALAARPTAALSAVTRRWAGAARPRPQGHAEIGSGGRGLGGFFSALRGGPPSPARASEPTRR